MTDQERNLAVWKKLHAEEFVDDAFVVPDYSNLISCAWSIIKWIETERCQIQLCWYIESGSWFFGVTWRDRDYHAYAETAPKAICLAFLKLP